MSVLWRKLKQEVWTEKAGTITGQFLIVVSEKTSLRQYNRENCDKGEEGDHLVKDGKCDQQKKGWEVQLCLISLRSSKKIRGGSGVRGSVRGKEIREIRDRVCQLCKTFCLLKGL